jgi:uncharacterized repeat protein (TIGR01451 family)
VLALLAVACAALVTCAAAASADTTSVSSFTKRGVDQQNGSTAAGGGAAGTTAAGDTLKWVLGYRNTSGSTADVAMNDPIAGNQAYVPGSLQAPPGWSATEPSAGSSAVTVSGAADLDGSTGAADLFSRPLASFAAGSSNGDGFEALFIGDNIYNVHHHRGPSSGLTLLDCHVKATGAQCPGYPVDHVSPNAGDPFGTGPDVLDTPSVANAAVDSAAGKIYVAVGVAGSTDSGVLCIDVTNSQSCGYTSLGATKFPNPNPGAAANIVGGAQIGTKYYVLGGGDGAPVYCYDMTTQAACASWPSGGVQSAPGYVTTIANFTASNSLVTYGGYLFSSINNDDGSHGLGCVVVSTGADCAGYPLLRTTAAGVGGYAAPAPILDASGNVTGICQQTANEIAGLDTATGYACWSVNGGMPVGLAPYDQMVAGAGVGHSAISSPLQIGTRLYFDYITGTSGLGGASGPVTYTCWDSATNSACAGFAPVAGGDNVRPYTLRQDPFNADCVWELGDAGVFQVFSATFGGALGCNEGNATVQIAPSAYYCDGQSGHITGWRQLVLGGVSDTDYDSVAVTISDADGNALPGWSNRVFTSGQVPVDISSIPYAGSTTRLTVTVAINWGSHTPRQASVSATFNGDAPQVCYSTKVGAALCAVAQPIDDDATAITSGAAGVGDAPGGNRSGTASFTLPADSSLCVADVKIRKTASPGTVVPGKTLTYRLEVTNDGPDAAQNVVIDDPLPRGLSFVSASAGCSASGDLVTCDVGTLAKGETRAFQVKTRVASSLVHSPTNTATVTSTTRDPRPENNHDTVTPPLRGEADLSITKTPAATQVVSGGQIMYTLVVRNNGPSDATGVKVTDPMAAGLALVSAQPGQGSCSTADGKVSCNLGTLAAGGSTQVLVTANTTIPGVAQITNTATVTGDQHDPTPENNNDRATITVENPPPPQPSFDLDVVKTANHRSVYLGQSASYRIVVLNRGPDAAPEARLTDTFGAKGKLVSVRTTAGRCVMRLPIICSLGTVRAHARVTITVVLKPTVAGSDKRNVASATGRGSDTNPSNNIDGALVSVKKVPLRLTKTVNRTVARAGSTFTYTIRVANPSAGVAHHVRVCDQLPSGLVYVSASPKAKLAKGRYCWSAIATLGAHRSHSYRITVRALRGTAGSKTNVATATSPEIARTLKARRTVRVVNGAIRGGGVTG